MGNDVVVVDLNSTNGTRVNGATIRERKLDDGDQIVDRDHRPPIRDLVTAGA